VDVTSSDTTIGDVLGAINATGLGVTASINSTGDGILLTDTAGGGSKLTVKNTETLTDVQQAITQLGFGASANIVNDGSGNNGYHLAITALNSGLNGRFTFDG